MHPVFIILLLLLLLIVVALWWPVELTFAAKLIMPRGAEVKLQVRFFHGLIRLNYRLRANLYDKPALHVLLYQGKEKPRILWKPDQPKKEKKPKEGRMKLPFQEIWRHIRIKKLRAGVEVGVKDDAFLTVLFTGFLSSFLQASYAAAGAGKRDAPLEMNLTPDFSKDSFRLNLEGIACCPPVHIISAILIWHLKNRKGQATVWRILSKTS
ncbi:MAG TPA: hypothetical protein VN366_02610 [Feifaniaceae bacterium]|nr:hypothetical protein [Feifaniaceae bacterium]